MLKEHLLLLVLKTVETVIIHESDISTSLNNAYKCKLKLRVTVESVNNRVRRLEIQCANHLDYIYDVFMLLFFCNVIVLLSGQYVVKFTFCVLWNMTFVGFDPT